MRKINGIFTQGVLTDLEVELGSRTIQMLGPAGAKRELSLLESGFYKYIKEISSASDYRAGKAIQTKLPVLLGSGLGYALSIIIEELLATHGEDFKMAVVDAEQDLLQLTRLREQFSKYKNIIWIDSPSPADTLQELSRWQSRNNHCQYLPLVNPFYLRINREYYSSINSKLSASATLNFWNRAEYSKFSTNVPRILLITSKYFLIGEIESACRRMGVDYCLLQIPDEEIALNDFLEKLLTAIISFKPDFALTINHLGVDREGMLQDFLSRMKLPLASWFVDNPHLILYHYTNVVSPWTAVFTWDSDNIDSLKATGFEHVFYLPLGTDHTRFKPVESYSALATKYPHWCSTVSFVGNSMLYKVNKRLEHANPPPSLRDNYKYIAQGFSASEERSVRTYLKRQHPELYQDFLALGDTERQLSYEAMLTWEATLQYRLSCVKATLPFNPLIAGDKGWYKLLSNSASGWRYQHELSYYTDLPLFYPLSDINFNCTSKQMKGAVNQRIFDVPAAAAFIITDWREQIENLFEPGKEVICYHSPEEASDLIAYYLHKPHERQSIIQSARNRVLQEHCYEHRLQKLIATMRHIFS